MQFFMRMAVVASLISLTIAQDVSVPVSKIPTCANSCISSAFGKQGCSDGDWKCFCSVRDGATGGAVVNSSPGHTTTECQSYAKGGCSRQDLQTTSVQLTEICALVAGKGASVSINPTLVTSALVAASNVVASALSAMQSTNTASSFPAMSTTNGTLPTGNATLASVNATGAMSSVMGSSTGAVGMTSLATDGAAQTGSAVTGSAGSAAQSSVSRAGAGSVATGDIGLPAMVIGALFALVV